MKQIFLTLFLYQEFRTLRETLYLMGFLKGTIRLVPLSRRHANLLRIGEINPGKSFAKCGTPVYLNPLIINHEHYNLTMKGTHHLLQYARLMRLHQPIGILLLLWPTLWALWIAGNNHPRQSLVAIFILGVILMRSAGCVINDFADRHFDGYVTRTKDRPLVTGMVSSKEALILFVCLCLLAFTLTLLTNTLTIQLAIIGCFLAIIYPFSKRYIHLPQVILGATFSWAIPMAFSAQTAAIPPLAWYLYAIATLWPIIYDTFYAMADKEDDLLVKIKSSALLFGDHDRSISGILQIILLLLLIHLGTLLSFNVYYYLSLLAVALLMLYQQCLIKTRLPQNCLKAFLNNQWIGAIIFIGIVVGYP